MVVASKTKKGVGYIRVSDPKQTGERHSSPETQEASYLDYCKQFDISPIAIFTDVVSGRRDDRKEYRRMVDFLMQGGAEVVIVKFLDRFGRNPREILRRYWKLQEHGIEVIATYEDINEEIVLLVKAWGAGAESKKNSERVRANMGEAIKKGVHVGRPPLVSGQSKTLNGTRLLFTGSWIPLKPLYPVKCTGWQ